MAECTLFLRVSSAPFPREKSGVFSQGLVPDCACMRVSFSRCCGADPHAGRIFSHIAPDGLCVSICSQLDFRSAIFSQKNRPCNEPGAENVKQVSKSAAKNFHNILCYLLRKKSISSGTGRMAFKRWTVRVRLSPPYRNKSNTWEKDNPDEKYRQDYFLLYS